MGRQIGKNQVVVYLPPGLHRRLRLRAAREGLSMSLLVERALEAHAGSGPPRLPLPRPPERPFPEVVEALAAYGAPLWSSGLPVDLSLEATVAAGLAAARQHPSLLRVLPVVLWLNRTRLSLARLRLAVGEGGVRPLGMLLDLTAEVTGFGRFRAWADRLHGAGRGPESPEPFFELGSTSRRYLELARLRTPERVRRWGYVIATPLDDFQEAVRKLCPLPRSSTARS